MPPTIQFFPFGPGLHQENDEQLQNAGAPRAIENLIRTKNGRLEPRRDYETIANTGMGSTNFGTGTLTNLRLYDLASYAGRILGFGRADNNQMRDHATDSTEAIFELLEEPTGNWRRAQGGELGQGTQARLVGRTGRVATSINIIDVAAGDGRVCVVTQSPLTVGGSATIAIHIFEAASDKTILSAGLSGRERPRVVYVGGVFWIGVIVTSTRAVELWPFNPLTDRGLPVSGTTVVVAGATINAWDMSPGADTDTFWLGVARSDTTTAIRGFDSTGTVTFTTAGPAVAADGISVFHQTTSGTARLHVVLVLTTSGNIDWTTYTPPSTTPTTDTDIFAPSNSGSQVAICEDPDGQAFIKAWYARIGVTDPDLMGERVVPSTLAIGAGEFMDDTPINSKALVVRNRALVMALIQESDGFYTHAVLRANDTINDPFTFRPVVVMEHFLAHEMSRFHLPSIAFDASTQLAYFPLVTEDSDRFGCVQVLEMKIAGTDRRQTAELGDVLYISGAIMQAYDGRVAHEAGGFLTRPYITSIAGNPSGDLEDPGVYQVIAVETIRDAKNRRIQSGLSNLAVYDNENGADGPGIALGTQAALTIRAGTNSDNTVPQQFKQIPTVEFYRTLNTMDGNGTFHLDESLPSTSPEQRVPVSQFLTQSDDAISDNEILYAQGARGALSGPLEFEHPLPCTTICASADRILSGNLSDETLIQESRPLFPGEQVNWSNQLGFFRGMRGGVLAVSRLDERRIIMPESEIFECDGPGLDDNGLGDIGAPRRLPSDVGLYGGILGWRSIVEMSAGIMFQGLKNQIYLLPRGGVTPVPIGFPIEDKLLEYPVIAAAVYMNEDQTVRFCCNNEAGDESIILLFNVRFTEWYVEGPYSTTFRSAAKAGGRFYTLDSAGTVLRQRTEPTPLTFADNAWRSGVLHPFNPGMFGRMYAFWFYGTFDGNCRIRCVVRWDDDATEEHDWVDVVGLEVGAKFNFRFEFEQLKCESCTVDFEIESFQGEASRGLLYNYWAMEREPSGTPNLAAPERMS